MDILPLETIIHIFSFTDVSTWHRCRQTCSTIARMLKRREFVIKSVNIPNLNSVIGTLKSCLADRSVVRFTKIPKATRLATDFDLFYKELSELKNITALDEAAIYFDSVFDRPIRTQPALFPLQKFTHLESLRVFNTPNQVIELPPRLTSLSTSGSIIHLASVANSKILDLDINLYAADPNIFHNYINITRLVLRCDMRMYSFERLTSLKVLELPNHTLAIKLQTTSLESLQIGNVSQVDLTQVSKNTNLTSLAINAVALRGVHPREILTLRSLTKLQALSINAVQTETVDAVALFMKELPNLENLTINVSDEPTENMSEIFPLTSDHLTRLKVELPRFATINLDMSLCTSLQELQLSGCTGTYPCGNLTSLHVNSMKGMSLLGSLSNVRRLRAVVMPPKIDLFPNLEDLILGSLPEQCDSLGTLTQLTTLIILDGSNRLDLPCLTSLTNLVQLHLPGGTHSTPWRSDLHSQVSHVIQLSRLEQLTLSYITSDELDLVTLHLTRLTRFTVYCKDGDGSALTRLTNLIELSFSSLDASNGLPQNYQRHLPYLVSYMPNKVLSIDM